MKDILHTVWLNDGQDIAEYAVMLAVILVIVVGTIRLVGSQGKQRILGDCHCDAVVARVFQGSNGFFGSAGDNEKTTNYPRPL